MAKNCSPSVNRASAKAATAMCCAGWSRGDTRAKKAIQVNITKGPQLDKPQLG
jgi:hypothetical protein